MSRASGGQAAFQARAAFARAYRRANCAGVARGGESGVRTLAKDTDGRAVRPASRRFGVCSAGIAADGVLDAFQREVITSDRASQSCQAWGLGPSFARSEAGAARFLLFGRARYNDRIDMQPEINRRSVVTATTAGTPRKPAMEASYSRSPLSLAHALSGSVAAPRRETR
jgi:hypothetical protein